MTPEQFGELLSELRAIKVILLSAAALMTLSVLLGLYRTWAHVRQQFVKGFDDLFRREGLSLLESGRLDELIAECERKLRRRPDHAYAHWYLGRAYYLQERWREARTEFELLRRISPDWASSIDPYMEEMDEKGGLH
jgi:cytochrome c-type biogenesis protein CcmH/NrfG